MLSYNKPFAIQTRDGEFIMDRQGIIVIQQDKSTALNHKLVIS